MGTVALFLQGMSPGIGLALLVLGVLCAICVAGTLSRLQRRRAGLLIVSFFVVIGLIAAWVIIVGFAVASPILAPK